MAKARARSAPAPAPTVARQAKARRPRRFRSRAVTVGGLTLLLAGGSAGAWAATTGDDAGAYRTATVRRAAVQQQLDLTGSVRQINQASAAFPVTGTVASVAVAVGDQVTAGQELARLRTDDLQAAVTGATATLAQAKATLESDQDTGSTATGTTQPVTGKSNTGGSTGKPSAAQRAVNNAQRTVDRDLKAAANALAAQGKACAPPATPKPTATPSATPSGSASPATRGDGGDPLARCQAAIKTTQRAQTKLAASQATLSRATTAWAAELAKSATAPATSTASTPATSTGTAPRTTSSGGAAAQTSGPASASQLSRDEADIVAAQAELDTANDNLAAARLNAPISGTIGSLGMTAGAAIKGGEQIVIVGTGAAKVTVNVPLANIRKVKVGQQATVTPDGASTPLAGTVNSIGLLPAAAASTGQASGAASGAAPTGQASSGVAYPVVILVEEATPALATGSQAGVSITVGSTGDVLAVPNSAVTSTGGGTGFVLVLVDGVATRKTVRTGTVGSLLTEITSGATLGQHVVLADLSRELPTSSSTANRPGGGFAPGGPTGGGFNRGAVPPR
jgi:HlyD family secretion protein